MKGLAISSNLISLDLLTAKCLLANAYRCPAPPQHLLLLQNVCENNAFVILSVIELENCSLIRSVSFSVHGYLTTILAFSILSSL